MSIYLDHTATTQPTPAVVACLCEALTATFANPSSIHKLGQDASGLLKRARADCAAQLGCDPQNLLLTSGGTESINLAIKGYVAANPRAGRRIITSHGEHAATVETLNHLEKQGYEIVWLPLTTAGSVNLDQLATALEQPAALITLIHVSNETGAVNPVDEIVRLRNAAVSQPAIHLDAVQTTGKLPIDFSRSGVDMISGSGHKVSAPKGIGWLAKRASIRLQPQIHGGGQQDGLRSGTENPPMAAALAVALAEAVQDLQAKSAYVLHLRRLFLDDLRLLGLDPAILSPEDAVPHILALSFPGLRGETLLHALEARGISISTGSACSSRHNRRGNPVLRAMGVRDEWAACAVRISFSSANQEEEIHLAARTLDGIYRQLHR